MLDYYKDLLNINKKSVEDIIYRAKSYCNED